MNNNNLCTEKPKFQAGVSLAFARQEARTYLSSRVDSASLDVDVLLSEICSISRLDVVTQSDKLLSKEELLHFKEAVIRRGLKEPIAYIIGKKEFYGLEFAVNQDVLIPRPDTELLVESAVAYLKTLDRPTTVIDVCTGSGCVAISVAAEVTGAHVLAIDKSEDALRVARQNGLRHGLCGRIDFRMGDLLSNLGDMQVDLIVANPPYIFPSDMSSLMSEVKDFEPELALVGKDEDGLGLHRELLSQSFEKIKPNGKLMMEIGYNQAAILANLIEPGFTKPRFLKDYSGVLRVVELTRLSSGEDLDNG